MKTLILFLTIVVLFSLTVASWAVNPPPSGKWEADSPSSGLTNVESVHPTSIHLFLLDGAACGGVKGAPKTPSTSPARSRTNSKGKINYDSLPGKPTTNHAAPNKTSPEAFKNITADSPANSGGGSSTTSSTTTTTSQTHQQLPRHAPIRVTKNSAPQALGTTTSGGGNSTMSNTNTPSPKRGNTESSTFSSSSTTSSTTSITRNRMAREERIQRIPEKRKDLEKKADSMGGTVNKIGNNASVIPKSTLKARKKESAAELKNQQKDKQ